MSLQIVNKQQYQVTYSINAPSWNVHFSISAEPSFADCLARPTPPNNAGVAIKAAAGTRSSLHPILRQRISGAPLSLTPPERLNAGFCCSREAWTHKSECTNTNKQTRTHTRARRHLLKLGGVPRGARRAEWTWSGFEWSRADGDDVARRCNELHEPTRETF